MTGMLLSMAAADAYCIAWEFVANPTSHGLTNDFTYQQNPRYPELSASRYTDDTLRALSTALIVTNGEGVLDSETYAHALQVIYMEDDRPGWSKRFQEYLANNYQAKPLDFIAGIKPATSNGALMGAAPIGYLANENHVMIAAAAQAVCTHSFQTVPYAQAIALAAHHFLNGGRKVELVPYLENTIERDFLPRKAPKKGMHARETCEAILDLLIRCRSLTQIITTAAEDGGDTDSIAAQAVAIASCSNEYEQDIPANLIEDLEEGDAGQREYLKEMDLHLKALQEK